ncbi:MAG: hypothetical protein IKF53_03180 [Clostridia bacterium]|nr:hypothetical protein [Clostridia bacterium]
MKLIMKGEIYEIIADSSGLLFSYFDGYDEEGNLTASFKMISRDNTEPTVIHKDIYKLSKYGANYTKILKHCPNYILAKGVLLSDGKDFIVNSDGTAILFDGEGEIMWTGTLKYKNRVPDDIALTPEGLWGTFSDFDAVVRFNAASMREELRIGKKGQILNTPKGIFAEQGALYVASHDSKKVIRIDLPGYKTTELYTFSEPVYSYVKVQNKEYVLLESGLYEI